MTENRLVTLADPGDDFKGPIKQAGSRWSDDIYLWRGAAPHSSSTSNLQ